MNQLELSYMAGGNAKCSTTYVNTVMTQKEISILSIYQRKQKHIHMNTYLQIFRTILFVAAPNWKQQYFHEQVNSVYKTVVYKTDIDNMNQP